MAKKNTGGAPKGRARLSKKASLRARTSFLGKGLKKAPRRANGAAKGDRLLYPRIRPDQYGTPAETMIKREFADFINQRNDPSYSGGDQMHYNDAKGSLHTKWKSTYKKNLAPMIRRFITDRKVGARGAKNRVNDIFLVSFGADPKNR